MGDLDSETTELFWLNIFYVAAIGTPSSDECLRNLDYEIIAFPKFKIFRGTEDETLITPDFLLWNKENKIALLIEVKGENSVNEENLDQLKKYREISIQQIQTRIRNIKEDLTIIINDFYYGIAYRKETIDSCINSQECIERLNVIKENNLVIILNPGEKMKSLNIDYIDFDQRLRDVLDYGISLPQSPPSIIKMTENPCLKGVLWGIINYVHDRFFDGTETHKLELNPIILRNNFNYTRVKTRKLEQALTILFDLNLCRIKAPNHQFKFEDFENFEKVIREIDKLECSDPKMIQRDLTYRQQKKQN